MAAREHGLGQLVRARREQQDHRVGRWLLEHLEEHVGCRGVEPVGLADHEDLAARLGRGAERGMPDLRANRIDVDIAALGLDDELVRVLVIEGEPAVAALAAAPALAEQCRRERPSGEALAPALGTGEQVGVMRARGGLPEERHRLVLPGDAFEDARFRSHRQAPCDPSTRAGAR